jgi:hypothetical protein
MFATAALGAPTDTAEVEIVAPDSAFDIAASEGQGKAEAERNIKAGVFRIYEYGDWHPVARRVDSQTGYPIQRITDPNERDGQPTKAFSARVAAYNQAMTEWHRTHK